MRLNPDGIKFTDDFERTLLVREFEQRRSAWIPKQWRGATWRFATLTLASMALAGALLMSAGVALALALFAGVLGTGLAIE